MENAETQQINDLVSVIEEQNSVFCDIRNEISSMQDHIHTLEAQLEEKRKENEILKERIDENTNRDSLMLSNLMQICAGREKTLLTTIWSLTAASNVIAEKLAENNDFVNLLIELLKVEVVQEVIKPVLGILANICYSTKYRHVIGKKILSDLFTVKVDSTNQNILATLIMNITLDKELVLQMVDTEPIFEKIEEFLRSKTSLKCGECIVINILHTLCKQDREEEFLDFFVNIAKKYQLSPNIKREIGMLVVS